MKLNEAWNLIDSINNNVNQISKDIWDSGDINEAILYHSACFREKILQLRPEQIDFILTWIDKDDEFRDYFNCLSNNMTIDVRSKS